MRRAWLVIVVAASTRAHADAPPPSPARELAAMHTRVAIDAARAGSMAAGSPSASCS